MSQDSMTDRLARPNPRSDFGVSQNYCTKKIVCCDTQSFCTIDFDWTKSVTQAKIIIRTLQKIARE